MPSSMPPSAPSPSGRADRQHRGREPSKPGRNPFVPLLLGTSALLAWFGLQTWLLSEEGATLQAAHASQQQTVDNATKLRQSLDAIAADTQRLADSSNPNARLLVQELRRRGITINPDAPAAAASQPAAKP